MAAGLVAMLPRFLEEPAYFTLGRYMVAGIVCAGAGLVASVVHNRLRRKCSLEHDRKPENRGKPYVHWLLVKCQTVPGEAGICTRSIIRMWSSLALFCVGAVIVCIGFLLIEPREKEAAAESPTACWEVARINSGYIRFNQCTGETSTIPAIG